jgi:hypothetical protein
MADVQCLKKSFADLLGEPLKEVRSDASLRPMTHEQRISSISRSYVDNNSPNNHLAEFFQDQMEAYSSQFSQMVYSCKDPDEAIERFQAQFKDNRVIAKQFKTPDGRLPDAPRFGPARVEDMKYVEAEALIGETGATTHIPTTDMFTPTGQRMVKEWLMRSTERAQTTHDWTVQCAVVEAARSQYRKELQECGPKTFAAFVKFFDELHAMMICTAKAKSLGFSYLDKKKDTFLGSKLPRNAKTFALVCSPGASVLRADNNTFDNTERKAYPDKGAVEGVFISNSPTMYVNSFPDKYKEMLIDPTHETVYVTQRFTQFADPQYANEELGLRIRTIKIFDILNFKYQSITAIDALERSGLTKDRDLWLDFCKQLKVNTLGDLYREGGLLDGPGTVGDDAKTGPSAIYAVDTVSDAGAPPFYHVTDAANTKRITVFTKASASLAKGARDEVKYVHEWESFTFGASIVKADTEKYRMTSDSGVNGIDAPVSTATTKTAGSIAISQLGKGKVKDYLTKASDSGGEAAVAEALRKMAGHHTLGDLETMIDGPPPLAEKETTTLMSMPVTEPGFFEKLKAAKVDIPFGFYHVRILQLVLGCAVYGAMGEGLERDTKTGA